MGRIDIPVSEIGSHFQLFLLLMNALGEMTCFSVALHYLLEKIAYIAVYTTIDQLMS